MIGYHFTGKSNYDEIVRERQIKPYDITNEDVVKAIGPTKAVWLWQKRPKGKSELGCILWQVSQKNTTDIVLLECEFDAKNLFYYKGQKVQVYHEGKIFNFTYHSGFPSYLVEAPVKKFKLIKRYDLLDLVK